MMSSACQNSAKQSGRRSTAPRIPLIATWAIITASHTSPAATCSPWQPTSVKNAERNAAALRGRAAGNHVGELADLQTEERGSEQEGDESKEVDAGTAPVIGRQG